MKKLISILFVAALAACGGGDKKPVEPTPDPQPDPTPVEPTPDPTAKPDEPVKPDEPPPPDPKVELMAAETAAFEKAKPVFEKFCGKCHSDTGKSKSAKKLGHLNITAYPFTSSHGATLAADIRKALAIGGGKPTMPADKKGSVKGDDLAAIAAWADAWDAAEKGGAHEAAATPESK
jgi:outer membrane biosynthesis protein TonB